ncbi:extracellular solute-binding protein [Bifidobacterium gallicum]|uniref:ABC transporter substrate-binding protein n=1 Tax=Bifidobacterium gallicum DSM 20093 = LMG 11596 TaxID=561180 RepID=D1NX23_9BIFI|nr:extracellular solute-binding protein [Bifidobacterium gallicum]EFA22083.1 ABC transporter, solute-binding protein [Bifidobacterium gallicum DSM 20093 = LMG 11596]KFI59349.1 ABC transporter substrate-binding protein [Bifidobacterium gallicum DSM 20093 = LMG 11596]
MINWKKSVGFAAAAAMLLPLAACGSDNNSNSNSTASSGSTEKVTLSVWAPAEDQADDQGNWLKAVEDAFAKAHPEYEVTWKNDVVSEGDVSKQVKTDPSAAADVYMFANDQLGTLIDLKAIGELPDSVASQVKEQNDTSMVNSVQGTDGKLYGVPYTGNTWFMYYNKSKYSADDIKSFNTLLEKGKVAFPLSNSWYIPAFYVGGGMTFFGENGTDVKEGIKFGDKAVDVSKYLVDVANNANFINDQDGSGLAALKTGDADVYFSGSWDAASVKEALGDNYAAAQLPTFNCAGEDMQMKSFAGSKAAAYNPNASNTKAAALFAGFLGSTEAQKLHWEKRQIIPTDKSLADLEGISADPAAQAQINTIANTSIVQPTIAAMNEWWTPAESFGKAIVNKDVTADNAEAKTKDWEDQLTKALASFQQ